MQPTVLPWSGYFNLILESDIFVFLDDVQLEKQSWQTRNKLIFEKKEAWLTIPIKHSSVKQVIANTEVLADKKWRQFYQGKFKRNYENHPFYEDGLELFLYYIDSTVNNLALRNELWIKFACAKLNICTAFYRASDFKIEGIRSQKLINFCDFFKASKYLSPIGSKDYLEADDFTKKTKVKLEFQNYFPQTYPQVGMSNFVSHLSILDVVCNLGYEGAGLYIKC